MGQQSLIYSFVARGTVILAEYTEFTGNFTSIASQCLQKLPVTNNKLTYNCDGHTFNYLVDNGFTYCVVAVEAVGRQVPIAFLERIKEDFTGRYGGGKAATAVANSLNKEFGSHEYHQETLNNLRAAMESTGILCTVMLDTKGPQIRTGATESKGKNKKMMMDGDLPLHARRIVICKHMQTSILVLKLFNLLLKIFHLCHQ
ncbi:synptobrevin-related protein [Pyrus ussuriensis x Pyrus communis]|uniref:Synptobrevin-related protein n=1 Tax=Pyrus ussuriensis x Pyrus communis TaxID=2448454 RepID=A0A5N5F3F5_9ROSA|nr:synptobrevin-related protein [Pyrus ussuriensis x Pyrus communis]